MKLKNKAETAPENWRRNHVLRDLTRPSVNQIGDSKMQKETEQIEGINLPCLRSINTHSKDRCNLYLYDAFTTEHLPIMTGVDVLKTIEGARKFLTKFPQRLSDLYFDISPAGNFPMTGPAKHGRLWGSFESSFPFLFNRDEFFKQIYEDDLARRNPWKKR